MTVAITRGATHALVIGGGIAGLFAARILSEHFERVTLLERDVLPEGPEHRRGTPQSLHHHVMLAAGRDILEGLFPGLDEELAGFGTELVDWGWDCRVFSSAGEVPRFRSGLVTRPSTRPLLEWRIRSRVRALGNVAFREDCRVQEVLIRDGRAIGARTEEKEEIGADLVIDASGRNSRAPRWLEGAGYDRPEEQVVSASLGYATRMYRRPERGDARWKAILVAARYPDNPRAAGLWPQEGGRWLLTLAGTAGHHPPADEPGFLAFAKALSAPAIHEAVAGAESLTPIASFRNTDNQWRRYDRLKRMPEALLIIGDAACAFNPIYGQGMTVAAMQAKLLDRSLRRIRRRNGGAALAGLSMYYHRRVPALIQPAWLLATSEDLRWSPEGARADALTRASHWYIDRLMALTTGSPVMAHAFLSVMHLVAPPRALLRPAVSGRILAHILRFDREPRSAPSEAGAKK